MNVLVAGGAGFIGSHLIDKLLEEGHKVICIDNLSLGTKDNISHLEKNSRFVFYRFDLNDLEKTAEVFRNEAIDYVFHLAANSDIQASAKNPEVEYRNTYTTTYHLLECMRRFNVKRIFFASTSAVYGDKQNTILDENTAGLQPVSYYGAAKLGSEALISAFSYMNDFHALIFRFPNVIGPRLTHGVIYDFIRKLSADPYRLEILGDGMQTKPYLYVADLIDAITLLKNKTEKGISLYNIGVDTSTNVRRIADILCEEMKLEKVSYKFSGGSSGWKGDVPRFSYSLDKIHRTGWQAKYSSDEAVRKTIKNNLYI